MQSSRLVWPKDASALGCTNTHSCVCPTYRQMNAIRTRLAAAWLTSGRAMRLDTFTLTRYTSDKPVRWNAFLHISLSDWLTLCCEDARSVRRMLSPWQPTSLHSGLDVWAKATRGNISMRLSMSLTPNQRDPQQPQTLCWWQMFRIDSRLIRVQSNWLMLDANVKLILMLQFDYSK